MRACVHARGTRVNHSQTAAVLARRGGGGGGRVTARLELAHAACFRVGLRRCPTLIEHAAVGTRRRLDADTQAGEPSGQSGLSDGGVPWWAVRAGRSFLLDDEEIEDLTFCCRPDVRIPHGASRERIVGCTALCVEGNQRHIRARKVHLSRGDAALRRDAGQPARQVQQDQDPIESRHCRCSVRRRARYEGADAMSFAPAMKTVRCRVSGSYETAGACVKHAGDVPWDSDVTFSINRHASEPYIRGRTPATRHAWGFSKGSNRGASSSCAQHGTDRLSDL